MPTKREMGYRIFRASGSAASSGASKVGGTTDTSSTVRYGTAVADSSGGRVQVKLDNSDSVVNCTCDTLIYKDDRVTVIVTSTGLMKAIPIGQNLVDYTDKKSDDLAQDIINQGNQIREDVADDIAEIDAKVDAAQAAADAAQGKADAVGNKADQIQSQLDSATEQLNQKTDAIQNQANKIQSDLTETADELAGQINVVNTEIDGLNSTITGVASDATSALTQVAQVKSDVDGLEVTVSQQAETLNGTIQRVSKTETDINGLTNTVSSVSKELDTTVTSVSSLSNTVDGLESTVSQVSETVDGTVTSISKLTNTVNGLESDVQQVTETANGTVTKVSNLSSTVDGLSQSVSQVSQTVDGTVESVSTLSNTVDGLSQTVSKVSNTVDGTVESVSKLTNTVNGLSSTVTQTTKTANEALSKSSTLENTVDGMQSTVSQAYSNSQEALTQTSTLSNTVDGLSSKVTTAYENADEALTQSSEAKQTADTVQTTLSTNYYTKGQTDQTFASQTQLTQTQNSILSQVSNKYQVKGDYPTTKDMNTAIEQSASQIQSTVEENVMNEVGETYATKTQLTQTSSDLTLKINSSIASGYATCTTGASTRAKVATTQASGFTRATGIQVAVKFTYANTARNPTLNINSTGAAAIQLKGAALTVDDSWEAGDTVVFVFDGTYWQVADPSLQIAKTVSSYFKADTTGLEVGREGDLSSVKMAATGRFQTLKDGEVTFELYEDNGTTYLSMPGYGDFQIRALTNLASLTNAGFRVSTLYNGFAVNTERGVQVWSGSPSSTSSDCTVSPVFLSYTYSNVQYVVIYYHGTFGSGYRSIKVPVTYGHTVAAYLTEYARGSNPTSVVLAIEGIDVTVNRTNISISRGATSYTRANIATSVGVNGTASSTFRIDKIAICC